MPIRIRSHIKYPVVAPPPEPITVTGSPLPIYGSPLTDSERIVLRRLWPDYSIKEIAGMMHRGTRTVSTNAKRLGLPQKFNHTGQPIIVCRNTPPAASATTAITTHSAMLATCTTQTPNS